MEVKSGSDFPAIAINKMDRFDQMRRFPVDEILAIKYSNAPAAKSARKPIMLPKMR